MIDKDFFSAHSGMSWTPRERLLVLMLATGGFLVGTVASAQTTATLDGTSGSNDISTTYSTTGGLTLDLGFFADYLLVGGGGGGGGTPAFGGAGGGGGGQVLKYLTGEGGNTGSRPLQLNDFSYTITIGGGGARGQGSTGAGLAQQGGTTAAFDLSALGGGAGLSVNQTTGGGGASGGGGSAYSLAPIAGGPGTVVGTDGGAGNRGPESTSVRYAAGGGGGAGGRGGDGLIGDPAVNGGSGGSGISTSIGGSEQSFGGGGGGGVRAGSTYTTTAGAGVAGGGNGGNSGSSQAAPGSVGTANTGGGGGGSGRFSTSITNNEDSRGGAGGSGLAVVRYEGASLGAIGGTVGSGGGYTWHTFNSSSALNLTGVDFDTRLGATLTSALSGDGDLIFSGPGRLTLANAANDYSGATIVSAGTLAIGTAGAVSGTSGFFVDLGATLDLTPIGGLTLASGQSFAGSGTILGDLAFGSGSQFVFGETDTLAMGNGTLSFASTFGVANISGLSSTTPLGTYVLFSGDVDDNHLANVGAENPFNLGDGVSAYFQINSLELIVVPEPGSTTLLIAALGAGGWMLRRRQAVRVDT